MDAEILKTFFKNSDLAFLKSTSINEVIFDDRAKYMCKFGCKNYNRKYSCPPASLHLKNRILKNYDIAILFATTFKVPDGSSRFQIKAYNYQKECEMQRISLKIKNMFQLYNLDHIALSGGSCKRCKRCSFIDNKKCKKPMEKQVSMESIGIDCQETMHRAGFDFHMPNTDSINRCGCVFVNDKKFLDLELKKENSNQSFYKPTKKDAIGMCSKLKNSYPKLFENISLTKISEIKRDEIICDLNCSQYAKNFSSPPYSDKIDFSLWNYAVLWKWRDNNYNKYRYNQALKTLHEGFFSLGFYFALSIRDCYCDECDECTYLKEGKSICNYRQILAPSMQSQGINPKQFGNGKYGIELL